jgi:hypothetical protein
MEDSNKYVPVVFLYPSRNPMKGHGFKARRLSDGSQCAHIHRTETQAQKCADKLNKKSMLMTKAYNEYNLSQHNYASGQDALEDWI